MSSSLPLWLLTALRAALAASSSPSRAPRSSSLSEELHKSLQGLRLWIADLTAERPKEALAPSHSSVMSRSAPRLYVYGTRWGMMKGSHAPTNC